MLISLNNSIKLLLLRQNAQQLFYIRYTVAAATTVRHFCNENQTTAPVRVRFAPSPTGKFKILNAKNYKEKNTSALSF